MNINNKQYSGKALEYHTVRPPYSPALLSLLKNMVMPLPPPIGVDIGAGTGIWTKQLLEVSAWKLLFALEPYPEFLAFGKKSMAINSVNWIKAIAEKLPFKNHSIDFISFASTFNWVNQNTALQEVRRVLKRKGHLCLIWNPIDKHETKVLLETENLLKKLGGKNYQNICQKKNIMAKDLTAFLSYSNFNLSAYHEFTDVYTAPLRHLKFLWTYTHKLKLILNKKEYEVFKDYLDITYNSSALTSYIYKTKCWLVTPSGVTDD